jgi:membrane protein implicated in regulation of membrane protease activity
MEQSPEKPTEAEPGTAYIGWGAIILVIAAVAWLAFGEAQLARIAALVGAVNLAVGIYKLTQAEKSDA